MTRKPIRILFFFATLTLARQGFAGEPAPTPDMSPQRASPIAPAIQAAPGGGDMITVSPDRYYVTRAHIGPDGRVTTRCERGTPPGMTAPPR